MQKAVRAVAAVTGRICFIGLSIQIVLGLLWMFCNLTGFQTFGESILYEEISKNFLCDEYVGILYPVLVLFARGIGKIFSLPYYCVLYLAQLTVGLYAAHAFLQTLWPSSRLWNLWGSLAVLTFPMAMQCHMAVLPESFVGSFLLLELTWLFRGIGSDTAPLGGRLIRAVPFWLITTLLKPEYFCLGAVPMVLVFVYDVVFCGKKRLKRICFHLLLFACCTGFLTGMNQLTRQEGAYGRIQRSLGAAMFSRFSWSTMYDTYELWPEEILACVDRGMVWEACLYSDNLMPIVGSAVQDCYGDKRAEELFAEAARISYEQYGAQIRHEIAWDAFSYIFAPTASKMLLNNRGYYSYCMRNFDIMRSRCPLLTQYYFDYTCWWFTVGLVLTGFLQLILWGEHYRERKNIFRWCVMILFCMGLTVWYTMQGGGICDYKNTIVIGCIWTVWMALVSNKGMQSKEEAI